MSTAYLSEILLLSSKKGPEDIWFGLVKTRWKGVSHFPSMDLLIVSERQSVSAPVEAGGSSEEQLQEGCCNSELPKLSSTM